MFKTNKNSLDAFTLVELIVVIVILAILATIAFLSFSSQSASARDSTRLSDMSNIAKGLSVFNAVSGKLPMPDSYITLHASNTPSEYQGKAGNSVLGMIKMNSEGGKDPLDKGYYTYATNSSQSKFELLGFLEDGTNISLSYMPKSFAADYSKRFLMTKGDNIGILLSSGTLDPVENKISSTFTGVDLINVSTGIYVTKISNYETINDTIISKYSTGLVSYWDMETLSGGNLRDLGKYGNDGICHNGITTGTCGVIGSQIVDGNGKNGKAISFDGIDDYILTNLSPYDFENQTFTIDTVFKYSGNNNGFLFAEGAAGGGWGLYDPPGGQICTFIKNIANSQSTMCSSGNLNDNIWYHVTVVTTTSTTDINYIDKSKVYVNGVLVTTISGPGVAYNSSLLRFSIGGRNEGLSNNFKGVIDEIRIYNRALSDSEIYALNNATK